MISIKSNLSGKKILMVIAPNFRDPEYNVPKKIFIDAKIVVKTASLQAGQIKGDEGSVVKAELSVNDVEVNKFDAVIFVGGPGMAQILENQDLINLAQQFYQAKKLTCAICVAPIVLANAGILKNKKATVWQGAVSDLENKGANYTGASVEQDNLIITANGPKAAQDFALAIMSVLGSIK